MQNNGDTFNNNGGTFKNNGGGQYLNLSNNDGTFGNNGSIFNNGGRQYLNLPNNCSTFNNNGGEQYLNLQNNGGTFGNNVGTSGGNGGWQYLNLPNNGGTFSNNGGTSSNNSGRQYLNLPNNGGTFGNNGGTSNNNSGRWQYLNLPPGYRFKPLDFELILYYLQRKVEGQWLPVNCINEVNIYLYDPETLKDRYKPMEGNEMYFFTPRDRKYKKGSRPDRAAGGGYWKASGKDIEIKFRNETVGKKKTLVFYCGKPPKGEKTNWIMHEYRLNNNPLPCGMGENGMKLDDYVLCRIYNNRRRAENQKSGEDGENQVNEEEARSENTEPESYGEAQGYVENVNMPIGGLTAMGFGDNPSVKMESNFHGYENPVGFFPNNHLQYGYTQVPQPYIPNNFDYSVQMVAPLSSVESNFTNVKMNEYPSTVSMPIAIQKEEEVYGPQEAHRYNYLNEKPFEAQKLPPFHYLTEQSNYLVFDKFHAEGGEGSWYNNEEASKAQDSAALVAKDGEGSS